MCSIVVSIFYFKGVFPQNDKLVVSAIKWRFDCYECVCTYITEDQLMLLIYSRCGLWLLYGLQKPDHNIVLVNIVGVVLMSSYVLVFYVYTLKKSVVLKQAAFMGVILFTIILYSITSDDYQIVSNRLGKLMI